TPAPGRRRCLQAALASRRFFAHNRVRGPSTGEAPVAKKASARDKAAKTEGPGSSPAVPWSVIYFLLAAAAVFTVLVGIYLQSLVVGGFLVVIALAAYFFYKIARQMRLDAIERDHYVSRLRLAEARTRQILDTAGDGILTVDELGTIKSFNRA